MEEFMQWLQEAPGSFRGAPVPRWSLVVIGIFFVIQIVLAIIKKIKKKK